MFAVVSQLGDASRCTELWQQQEARLTERDVLGKPRLDEVVSGATSGVTAGTASPAPGLTSVMTPAATAALMTWVAAVVLAGDAVQWLHSDGAERPRRRLRFHSTGDAGSRTCCST